MFARDRPPRRGPELGKGRDLFEKNHVASWLWCAFLQAPMRAPGLVETTRGVLVAAGIKTTEVVGQPEQEPKLFYAQIGARERGVPAPRVGSLDELFQHVHGHALDTVAHKKLVGAGEAVDRGYQPENEAVVGRREPAPSRAPDRSLSRSRVPSAIPQPHHARGRVTETRPGGSAPWTPAGCKEVKIHGVSVLAIRKPS